MKSLLKIFLVAVLVIVLLLVALWLLGNLTIIRRY